MPALPHRTDSIWASPRRCACLVPRRSQDAQKLRRAVAGALERASQPGLTDSDRSRVVRFVVVSGIVAFVVGVSYGIEELINL